MANNFADGITLTETNTTSSAKTNAALSFSRMNSYIVNTAASGKIYLNSTIGTDNNWGYFDATGFNGNATTATTAVNLENKPTLNLTNTSGTGAILSVTAGGKISDTITLGATSLNAMINALTAKEEKELTAGDYIITQYVGGGTSTVSYHRRPANKVINATLVKAALGTNSTHGGAYLRKDGIWAVPPDNNTTYTFTAGTSTLAWNSEVTLATTGGLAIKAKLPANPATFANGTSTLAWNSEVTLATVNGSAIKAKLPANPNIWQANTISQNGYVTAPTASNANKVWKTNADGVPSWRNDANTTYSVMTGATSSTAGASGLVPAPAKGDQSKFLTGAGTWTDQVVTLTGAQSISGAKTFTATLDVQNTLKAQYIEINNTLKVGNSSGTQLTLNNNSVQFANEKMLHYHSTTKNISLDAPSGYVVIGWDAKGIILTNNSYGTYQNMQNISNPQTGQIFFQLI